MNRLHVASRNGGKSCFGCGADAKEDANEVSGQGPDNESIVIETIWK